MKQFECALGVFDALEFAIDYSPGEQARIPPGPRVCEDPRSCKTSGGAKAYPKELHPRATITESFATFGRKRH